MMSSEEPIVRSSISAIVVCFNEEEHIERCLSSVMWCDEIVVVDSYSTDRTAEICRRFTDTVIQRKWTGYRDQKEFAHSQATKDWVLLVDSDEEVSPELKEEIETILTRNLPYAGYLLPRLVYYLGRWWRRAGWYPDYTLRLFRRDKGSWGGSEPHEKVTVDGPVRRLIHPLFHYSYRNIEDHIHRINRFTSISSRELRREKKSWSLHDALIRPAWRFFRSYFIKRGFMEGFAGFHVAVTAAVYVFLKYAKLWELELEEKKELARKRS